MKTSEQFSLYEANDFCRICGIKEVQDGIVEIPDSLEGKPVTSLKLFDNSKKVDGIIKEIHIPSSVTEIVQFCWVTDRVSVANDNPNYATDGRAIFNKDMTELILFPVSETEEYNIPDSVKKISNGAFRNHPRLRTISIPESVLEIGSAAFSGCKNLIEIFGGIGITTIGKDAFFGTPWLNDGEEKIFGGTLYYQCALAEGKVTASIAVPAGVKVISLHAFPHQIRDDIKTITLPETVETIEGGALQLPAVKELYIPRKVGKIEEETLPSCVSYIARWELMISNVADIEAIHVAPENETYADIDGVLFSKDLKTLVLYPINKKEDKYIIPEGTETIGAKAFVGNRNIIELVLPESLQSIEVVNHVGAMAGMQKLRKVTIGNSIQVIPENAFSHCKQLETVKIGNSIVRIDDSAFESTNISKIDFPESLQRIGFGAFRASLRGSIVRLPEQLEEVSFGNFGGCKEVIVKDSARAVWIGRIENTTISIIDSTANQVKYKVFMCHMDEPEKVQTMLTECWGEYTKFDFAALDSMFNSYKQMPHKLKTAVLRLEYPIDLTEEAEKTYRAFIKRNGQKILPDLIAKDLIEDIQELIKYGAVSNKNIDALIETASKHGNNEITAMLLECRTGTSKRIAVPKLFVEEPPVKEWKSNKETPKLIGRYLGTETKVVFPTEWDGTEIIGTADASGKTPDNYERITEVIIPEGYTSLGAYALCGCKNLEKVSLPATLTTIGDHCFEGCESLKDITLPDSLISIGNYAFNKCNALSDVRFGAALASIGNEAFSGCIKLKTIDLGEKVKKIGSKCFVSAGLETVIFRGERCYCPEHMCFSYPRYVYSDGQIDALGIPASTIMPLSYIGYHAGEILKKASKDLLSGITVSGRGRLRAFFKDNTPYHSYREETDLPFFVNQLGGTYSGRLSSKVDICVVKDKDPKNEAFIEASDSGAAVLTEIEFLDLIRESNKIDIAEIRKQYASSTTKPAKKADKNDPFRPAVMKKLWAYELLEDGTYKLTDYKGKDNEVVVPERIGDVIVTKIGAFAFSTIKPGRRYDRAEELQKIKEVRLPDSINEICTGAFWDAGGLESIRLSPNVSVIGDSAFRACRALKEIELPDSLKAIGEGAFEQCGFTGRIVIPSSVQSIGPRAFGGCKSMADSNGFIIFGTTLSSYEGEENEVTIPSGIEIIGEGAFEAIMTYGHSEITCVHIPNSVTEIGDKAFANCEKLSDIVIPDSVTKIGKHAFSGCKALADKEGFVIVNETLYSYYGDNKEVSIPDDVISIESEAFWQAGEMTKLYISENVVSIDPYMVGYGSRLKTIITSKGSAAELFAKEHDLKIEYRE